MEHNVCVSMKIENYLWKWVAAMSFWNVVGVNLISALDIGRVAKYFLLVGCVDTASAAFLFVVFRKHVFVKRGSRLRSAMGCSTALTPTLSLPWGSSPLICCAQVKSHNMILYV